MSELKHPSGYEVMIMVSITDFQILNLSVCVRKSIIWNIILENAENRLSENSTHLTTWRQFDINTE